MGPGADPQIVTDYNNWIKAITSDGTTYPKQFSDFGGQYYTFLNKFYANGAYAGLGNVKTDLQPSSLLNIFNTTNCK